MGTSIQYQVGIPVQPDLFVALITCSGPKYIMLRSRVIFLVCICRLSLVPKHIISDYNVFQLLSSFILLYDRKRRVKTHLQTTLPVTQQLPKLRLPIILVKQMPVPVRILVEHVTAQKLILRYTDNQRI